MAGTLSSDDLIDEIGPLFRFARALVRDEHLAADLVQDTLARAIERGEQYRGDAPLGAWLRRVLRNLATDRARRSEREVVVEEVEQQWHDDAYTVDPADVIERASTRWEVEDALARLPFIYRSTLVLHDIEGWTVQAIADLDDVGLPAAKQRLRRGRMALVSALATADVRQKALEGVPMRCWDARQHVSDYMDGVLDPETARAVESHLEHCPTCPPLYAALVGTHDAIGSLRDSDAVVPPSVAVRLRDFVVAASVEG